jgi:hypothetical protein
VHGFLFASWTAHIPQLKQHLGLSDSRLGLVLLGDPIGSVLALVLVARILPRVGSGPMVRLALLGYCVSMTRSSTPPVGSQPIWFQDTGDHDTPRQRWHFDLWLAPDVADQRIAAAVSTDGSVVDTSGAPTFTVLADPDGNRVCVCSAMGR